jgi:hypothetical protein
VYSEFAGQMTIEALVDDIHQITNMTVLAGVYNVLVSNNIVNVETKDEFVFLLNDETFSPELFSTVRELIKYDIPKEMSDDDEFEDC